MTWIFFAPPRGDGILRQYCRFDAGVVTMPYQARRTKEEEEVVEEGGEVDRNLMYKLEKSVMLTSSKVYAFSAGYS